MNRATVNGVELEYEVTGQGEPVLLISPVLADAFVPAVSEHVLSKRYQLIRYHRRGWVGREYWDRLTPKERRELLDLMVKSKGSRSNLTSKEQGRLIELFNKIRRGAQ